MTKTKALNMAEQLAENIEVNYFKMGGVLKLINDNSWFEGGSTTSMISCTEKYGFQGRKARYLIAIYDNLVTKKIPWEKVSHLGWTKLKDLAPDHHAGKRGRVGGQGREGHRAGTSGAPEGRSSPEGEARRPPRPRTTW